MAGNLLKLSRKPASKLGLETGLASQESLMRKNGW